jgi:hypothetical protein
MWLHEDVYVSMNAHHCGSVKQMVTEALQKGLQGRLERSERRPLPCLVTDSD